jgi:nicotinate-nucleotide adenylyltransferase
MKVGLFFGSFNPVHIGHLIIADSLLNAANFDEVWFVVSPHNPFKKKAGLAEVEQRINWVQKCISKHPKLKVCTIETELPLPSYTQQTLEALKIKHSNYKFHILMGSDSYQSLPKWKNAEKWIHQYPIEVYQRKQDISFTSYTKKTSLHQLHLIPISATELRNKIRNKESIRFWVLEEIRKEVIDRYAKI